MIDKKLRGRMLIFVGLFIAMREVGLFQYSWLFPGMSIPYWSVVKK